MRIVNTKVFKDLLAQQKALAEQSIEICNKYLLNEDDISVDEMENVLLQLCSSLLSPNLLDMELWKKPELAEIVSSLEDLTKTEDFSTIMITDISSTGASVTNVEPEKKTDAIIANIDVIDTDIDKPVNVPHLTGNSYKAEKKAAQIKERASLLRKIIN